MKESRQEEKIIMQGGVVVILRCLALEEDAEEGKKSGFGGFSGTVGTLSQWSRTKFDFIKGINVQSELGE